MQKIIIIYATSDGHTRKISESLQQCLQGASCNITVIAIDNCNNVNLNDFDKIIIGASIRYGKHSKAVYTLIRENIDILNSKPSAFFSVNLVARKPDKASASSNPYVRKFLQHIAWRPRQVAVFAGKLDYQQYRFFDFWMIRFIMWLTKGPTDPHANIEFTDWQDVTRFSDVIATL